MPRENIPDMPDNKQLLQCHNLGCGQKFDPANNYEDSCTHHFVEPVIHGVRKGWGCCNRNCTNFDDFHDIKGCIVSKHLNVKPSEQEEPVENNSSAFIEAVENTVPTSLTSVKSEQEISDKLGENSVAYQSNDNEIDSKKCHRIRTHIFEGMEYEILENEYMHRKLQTDHEFASQYFGGLLHQENSISTIELTDDTGPIWNHTTITLLLSEYNKRVNEFRNPRIKKKIIWRQIALVFKNHNIDVSYMLLDKKFRNMKLTYIRNKNNARRKSWPYTEMMDEIFREDESIISTNNTMETSVTNQINLPSTELRNDSNNDDADVFDESYNDYSANLLGEKTSVKRSASNDEEIMISRKRYRHWNKKLELDTERNNILGEIEKNTAKTHILMNKVDTWKGGIASIVKAMKERNEIMKETNDILGKISIKLDKLKK